MAKERDLDPRAAIESASTLGGQADEPDLGLSETLDSGNARLHAEDRGEAARVTVDDNREAAAPARIGRYLVLRQLGQGGMGTVYSAYDPDLDRKVAVKIVRGGGLANTEGQSRVLREAQAMARIAHPNVVSVFEVGQEANVERSPIFIAMELVTGGSLKDWQRQRRDTVTVDEIMRLYLQAAAGLEAAHLCGLIHRDFKPDNVLLGEDGRIRVADFGLARPLGSPPAHEPTHEPAHEPAQLSLSEERLTHAGAILGTPGYMSPEQVMGEGADARSDQFAFCAALYEALYQQLPFIGSTFEEFAANVCAGKLSTPPSRPGRPEVPLPIEQALRRGLSHNPADRFPSMQALSAALAIGLSPDSELRSSVRLKRITLLVLSALFVGLIVSTLAKGRHSFEAKDLRLAAAASWGLVLFALGTVLMMPRAVMRQPSYRKFTVFASISLLYSAIGRSLALLIGMSARHYILVETLGLTAIMALEMRHAGRRFIWPVALCGLNVVLQLLFPDQVLLTETILLNAAGILCLYLHPWTRGLGAAVAGRTREIEKSVGPPSQT